jgi:hypothetical protein
VLLRGLLGNKGCLCNDERTVNMPFAKSVIVRRKQFSAKKLTIFTRLMYNTDRKINLFVSITAWSILIMDNVEIQCRRPKKISQIKLRILKKTINKIIAKIIKDNINMIHSFKMQKYKK